MLPLVSEVEPTPLRTACARIPLHAAINVDTGQGVPESLSLQLKVCQRENLLVYTRNDLKIVYFLVLKLGGNWRT